LNPEKDEIEQRSVEAGGFSPCRMMEGKRVGDGEEKVLYCILYCMCQKNNPYQAVITMRRSCNQGTWR